MVAVSLEYHRVEMGSEGSGLPFKCKFVSSISSMCVYIDVDECEDGTHQCDANTQCTDTEGSYECVCSNGYVLENTSGSGDGSTASVCISK